MSACDVASSSRLLQGESPRRRSSVTTVASARGLSNWFSIDWADVGRFGQDFSIGGGVPKQLLAMLRSVFANQPSDLAEPGGIARIGCGQPGGAGENESPYAVREIAG